MKYSLLFLLFASLSIHVISQPVRVVSYYEWSDPIAFQLSRNPLITGYGEYSDSLSQVYDGMIFYEYDGAYYGIESWADYYYWYTKKYWYYFDQPELYEFFYLTGNDYGMASYIAGNYYRCHYYPSLISLRFTDRKPEYNRLRDTRYFAQSDIEVKRLNKALDNAFVKKLNLSQKMNSSCQTHNNYSYTYSTACAASIAGKAEYREQRNSHSPVNPSVNRISSVIQSSGTTELARVAETLK
ncbi:MAG: hypothetical protein JXB24_01145 [Bacteroidales bacterium]|nr:hypothetical protein [Bacteroidales bacterium]